MASRESAALFPSAGVTNLTAVTCRDRRHADVLASIRAQAEIFAGNAPGIATVQTSPINIATWRARRSGDDVGETADGR
jgi:hypothetical protein